MKYDRIPQYKSNKKIETFICGILENIIKNIFLLFVKVLKLFFPLLFVLDEYIISHRAPLKALHLFIIISLYYKYLLSWNKFLSTSNHVKKKNKRSKPKDSTSCQNLDNIYLFNFFKTNFSKYFVFMADFLNPMIKYLIISSSFFYKICINVFNLFQSYFLQYFSFDVDILNPLFNYFKSVLQFFSSFSFNFYLLFFHEILLRKNLIHLTCSSFLFSCVLLILSSHVVMLINIGIIYFSEKQYKRFQKNQTHVNANVWVSYIPCNFKFLTFYILYILLFSQESRSEFNLYYSSLLQTFSFDFYCFVFFNIFILYGYFFIEKISIMEEKLMLNMKNLLRDLEKQNVMEIDKLQLKELLIWDLNYFDSFVVMKLQEDVVEKYSYIFQEMNYSDGSSSISLIASYKVYVYVDQSFEGHSFTVFPSTTVKKLVKCIINFFKKKKIRVNQIISRSQTYDKNMRDKKFENMMLFELGIDSTTTIVCNPLIRGMGGMPKRRQRSERIKNKKQKLNPKVENFYSPLTTKDLKFPIKFFEEFEINREDYYYLCEEEWIKFQCLIYWELLEQMTYEQRARKSLSLTANCTFKKFLIDVQHISLNQIEDWKKEYDTGTLKYHYFLFDARQQVHNSEKEFNLHDLACTILCFMSLKRNSDYNIVDIFDQILFEISKLSPPIFKELGIDPQTFNLQFVIDGFQSMKTSFQDLESRNISQKTRSQIINHILTSFLLHNDTAKSFNTSTLHRMLEISKYYIDRANETAQAFCNNDIDDFNRFYEKRKFYHESTFSLIKQYYELKTIPAEGKEEVRIRQKNGKFSKWFPIRNIPCSINEFYYNFCKDPNFGGKCLKTDGITLKVPSFSTFIRNRPAHIKPLRGPGSCYCKYCMQFEQYLFSFHKVLRKYCTCKSKDCDTFVHERDCDFMCSPCPHCTNCCCDVCKSCDVDKLSRRFSSFMEKLFCHKHSVDGRKFGNLSCLNNLCNDCKFNGFNETFLNKFCPRAYSKINLQHKVNVRKWDSIEIETKKTKKKKKKSKYQVEALMVHSMTIGNFFEEFTTFLTQKAGFIYHHNVRHWQRHNYKTMIKNMRDGTYGDEIMMIVCDFAEAYELRLNTKKSSTQHYSRYLCNILGIIQFSWFSGEEDSCSNFIFSGYNVPKSTQFSIAYLKKIITNEKKRNPNLKYVHAWSDGANSEFLSRKMFGNMKHHLPDGIILIWHFFAACHGKNICDSEFSVLKNKFKRSIGNKVKGFQEIIEVYNYCIMYLNDTVWPRTGKVLKRRQFFYQKEDLDILYQDYKRIRENDVRLKRSVMWHSNGNFYRRFNSCACVQCSKPNDSFEVCSQFHDLCGDWKLKKMVPVKAKSESSQNMNEIEKEKSMLIL